VYGVFLRRAAADVIWTLCRFTFPTAISKKLVLPTDNGTDYRDVTIMRYFFDQVKARISRDESVSRQSLRFVRSAIDIRGRILHCALDHITQ